MAATRTVTESFDSREQSSTRIVLKLDLQVQGTSAEQEDDAAAKTAFDTFVHGMCTLSNGSYYYRGLLLQDYTLRHEGNGIWKAEYEFGVQVPAFIEQGQSLFAFDTTGAQQHITQARLHVADYPSQVNHHGAIGVAEKTIEGVDIVVPAFSFSVTVSTLMAGITPGYVAVLYSLTGKTNNAAWSVTVQGIPLTFAAGEALFLGCSGSQKTGEAAVLTFKFAAQASRTDIAIGDFTGISKKGWEYLWVEYEDDVASGLYVKKVKAVHIEQVYEAGNFSQLGLS